MSNFAATMRHLLSNAGSNIRRSNIKQKAFSNFSRYLILLLVSVSLCLACKPEPSVTLTEPLIVGNSPWPGFVAQFVAQEKGFYREEGIRIEEKHFSVSTDVDAALLSDKVDVAWTGVPDLIKLADEEPSFRLIAVSDYSNGADGIVAAGVETPEDLIGKTIAWQDLPLQALLLKAYLKDTNIEIKDLNLVLTTAAEAASAFSTGRVDAVVTFEPYLTNAIASRGNVIFSSKDTNLIAGGLIGKKSTLKAHKKDLAGYLRALDKGLAFYKSNRAEALDIVANKLDLPVEELGPIMNNVQLFSLTEHTSVVFDRTDPLNVIDSIDFAAEVSAELGIVPPSFEASKLYDDSYIKGI